MWHTMPGRKWLSLITDNSFKSNYLMKYLPHFILIVGSSVVLSHWTVRFLRAETGRYRV